MGFIFNYLQIIGDVIMLFRAGKKAAETLANGSAGLLMWVWSQLTAQAKEVYFPPLGLAEAGAAAKNFMEGIEASRKSVGGTEGFKTSTQKTLTVIRYGAGAVGALSAAYGCGVASDILPFGDSAPYGFVGAFTLNALGEIGMLCAKDEKALQHGLNALFDAGQCTGVIAGLIYGTQWGLVLGLTSNVAKHVATWLLDAASEKPAQQKKDQYDSLSSDISYDAESPLLLDGSGSKVSHGCTML